MDSILKRMDERRSPREAPRLDSKKLSLCSSSKARDLISFEVAHRLAVLPLALTRSREGEVLVAAAHRASDTALIQEVRFASGREVKLVQIDEAPLREAIYLAYRGDDRQITSAIEKLKRLPTKAKLPTPASINLFVHDGGPAEFLTSLIEYAVAHEVTDLHLLPRYDGCFVRMRKNGDLLSHQEPLCSLDVHKTLVSRIKALSNLDMTERRLPQDGGFTPEIHGRRIGIRVSSLPTTHGERMVLRFHGSTRLLTLEDLQISEPIMKLLEEFITARSGMVVLSGPTGSGKTTTMYALMNAISLHSVSAVSIEDPVEYELSNVCQTSINEETGLTWSAALRSVLRQDPDVIMLGEMRDEESAKLAFQAAVTGHRVLTTVHGGSVRETIVRLGSLGLSEEVLSNYTFLIISQRLVPSLCKKCRTMDLKSSNETGFEVYRNVGCPSCDHTGFSSQALVCEAYLHKAGESFSICAEQKNYYPKEVELLSLLKEGVLTMNDFLLASGRLDFRPNP